MCLAWEAPPYERSDRQIVYVSTQYRDNQPLWLFRNSAVAEVPVISRLFGDWSRTPDASGADPDNAFKEFHRSLPIDPNSAPWNRRKATRVERCLRNTLKAGAPVGCTSAGAEVTASGAGRLCDEESFRVFGGSRV